MTTLNLPVPRSPLIPPSWRSHALAAGVAVALHGAALLVLLAYKQAPLPAPEVVPVMTTQLVSLPMPAPAPMSAPVLAQTPPPTPVAPPKIPTPQLAPAPVQDAALALKRQQQKDDQVRQQQQREVVQQQQRDRQRQEQEQMARQADENRQREAAQIARQNAERAAAAERERVALASRQYLPISKAAPEYPQRALDKNLQGECTVSYTVDTQGRVQDPQVLGDCHPLFARPSLLAAKGFRYEPRIVEGKAVVVSGVKNTFHYRIE